MTLTVNQRRIVSRQVQVGRSTQTRRERVTEVRETTPGETEASVHTAIAQASVHCDGATGQTFRSCRPPSGTSKGPGKGLSGFLSLPT